MLRISLLVLIPSIAFGLRTFNVSAKSSEAPLADWSIADKIAASVVRPAIPQKSVSIVNFGATAEDALPAIKAAMSNLSSSGGGQIVIPAGTWMSNGPIHMQSRIELHVSAGATLQFSTDPKHYPEVITRYEGTDVMATSPLIYSNEVEDIAVTGTGTLDGQGKKGFFKWQGSSSGDATKLVRMGDANVPVSERRFGNKYIRPSFIQFRNSTRVLLDGPKIIECTFWCVHPLYSQHVTVQNIEIVSNYLNSDGVDPDSCSNVLIQNSKFNVNDDGVAVKAGRDADGRRVGIKSRDIVVRNNTYIGETYGGAISFGSELSGGIDNVWVDGYKVMQGGRAINFKANRDRGGTVSNIHIRNLHAAHLGDQFLRMETEFGVSFRGGTTSTKFEHITIEDSSAQQVRVAVMMNGQKDALIEDVKLQNVKIEHAQTGTSLAKHKGTVFDHVEVNGKSLQQ